MKRDGIEECVGELPSADVSDVVPSAPSSVVAAITSRPRRVDPVSTPQCWADSSERKCALSARISQHLA